MPNVMGREFPYTPEGMAAAEQYRRTLGMRDGGMMGFRPIGMQEGGVPSPEAVGIYDGLVNKTREGTTEQVAAYVANNWDDLNNILARLPPGQARFVASLLARFPRPEISLQAPQGQPDITAPLDRYPMDEALQQLETSAHERQHSIAPFLEGVLLPPEPMPPEPMPPEPMPYFNPDDIAVANGGYITRNRNRGGIMSLRRR